VLDLMWFADPPDLGVKGFEPDGTNPALRSVLAQMIEEYARHCGHADLLRERSTAASVSDSGSDNSASRSNASILYVPLTSTRRPEWH